MRIIADDTIPYLKGIAEPVAEVTYLDSKSFTPERVKEADVLIVRSIDKCTPALLAGSRVKLITTATIGFDHIDTHYCEQTGIVWKNAPGCNAASVAQYVLAGLVTLSLRTGVPLRGKTIGIVGVGHVGRIVENHCQAMGMRVLRNDPPRAAAEGAEAEEAGAEAAGAEAEELLPPPQPASRVTVMVQAIRRLKSFFLFIIVIFSFCFEFASEWENAEFYTKKRLCFQEHSRFAVSRVTRLERS